MSEEKETKLSVYEAPTFRKKAFKKFNDADKEVIEDEIDLVIENPNIGEQKKGDLSHLWVHKFILNNQQVLLGYSLKEEQLELWLLNIGSHENFYKKAKESRKSHLSKMK